MFDLVHKHKRIAQFILALIMIPFAFFGVDYYFRSSGGVGEVAKFDGGKITEAEFAQAIRDQQERLRQAAPGRRSGDLRQSGGSLQSGAADAARAARREEGRRSAFPGLELRGLRPHRRRSALSRRRPLLARRLQERCCAGAGITEPAYEDSIRRQILAERIVDPIARGGVVPKASAAAFVSLVEQQREVEFATIDVEPFVKDVTVDAAQEKAFYDANAAAFKTPEEAKFEYVVLTQDTLLAQDHRDAGGGPGAVRQRGQDLPPGGAAAGGPHPDRGEARRERRPSARRRRRPRRRSRRRRRPTRRSSASSRSSARRIPARRRRAETSAATRAARW